MPDVIPSARYKDRAFGDEFICNGVVDQDGVSYVVTEYDEYGKLSIPLSAFKTDEMLEIIELPEGQNPVK